MPLPRSKHTPSDDLLLDTSLSFEARSLYIVIESLSGKRADIHAPSLTVLAATTNWSRFRVRELITELVDNQLVQELAGHEECYSILEYQIKGDRTPASLYPFTRPERKPKGSVNSFHNILSKEEISALLNCFC